MKPTNWPEGIPYIDTKVKRVGVSQLRQMNASKLGKLNGDLLVVADGDQPLAVVLSYEEYLKYQTEALTKVFAVPGCGAGKS
jgi:hypothetical protein